MDKLTANQALSRIIRWVILAVVGYAIWTGLFHPLPHNGPRAGQPQETASVADKNCNKENSPLENFSLMASALMPAILPTTRTEDITPGTGEAAMCGQDASLRYEYALADGTVVFSNLKAKESTHITLGDNSLLYGLELGTLGMKAGGTRKIAFPPALGMNRAKEEFVHLHDADHFSIKPEALKQSIIIGTVSLESLSPPVPSSPLPLRVIERKFTSGARAMCGDTVRVAMTLWKLDGSKLFSTADSGKPLVFTIGDSQAPYGIEQAVTGMGEGGERTAIIPPAYGERLQIKDVLQNTVPALLPSLQWPDEIVLAEIQLQHIGEDTPPQIPQKP